MKYYPKRPIILYAIASGVGGLVLGLIILVIWVFSTDADPSDNTTFAVFLLSIVIVFIGILYFNHHKDYIELSNGAFNFEFDKKRKQPSININVRDVLVFEIVSFSYRWPKTKYFVIYATGHEVIQFNTNDVPQSAVIQFCSENALVPRRIILENRNTDNLVFGKKRLTFDYAKKWWQSGPANINYTDIAGIDIISVDPVSITENYYIVRTKKGTEYTFAEFSTSEIKRADIDTYSKAFGFPVVETKRYSE